MINYTPSSLDSNKTLLQEFHSIEKYLHDNPIYKVYAIDTDYVTGTSQYDVADIDGDASGLSQGDVIVFTNNYYAIVSAVGDEVVAVKNPSSFKGDKGDDGAQGEQGEQGVQGEAGPIALEVKTVYHINTPFNPSTSNTFSLVTSYFNRTPVVGDAFTCWVEDVNNDLFNGVASITAISSGSATIYIAQDNMVKVNGNDGATGKDALAYGIRIVFTYTSSSQLITSTLYKQYFNRDPEKNDTFIARLEDQSNPSKYISYIANCEVQSLDASGNVTSIIASDILRITGTDGTDGTDGTNGVDALTIGDIIQGTVAPNTADVYVTHYTSYDFNRMPVDGDTMTVVYEDTVTGKSYICIAVIQDVDPSLNPNNPTIQYQYRSIVETTGSTPSLYVHNIKLSKNSDSTFNIYLSIINDVSTPYTSIADIASYIYNVAASSRGDIVVNGWCGSTLMSIAYAIRPNSATNMYVKYVNITSYSAQEDTATGMGIDTVTDKVRSI